MTPGFFFLLLEGGGAWRGKRGCNISIFKKKCLFSVACINACRNQKLAERDF